MKMDYVKNVPEYAYNYKWWVVTKVENTYWFFGAYKTEERAIEVVNFEEYPREYVYNWDYTE